MSGKRFTIPAQFAWRLIAMLESPAYRALSQSAHRVLSRIEIEMAHHGGKDNGKLPVTYDDFEQYGIHRHSIRAAIGEVVALGFVEIMQAGRAGNAEFRAPNIFRLTYRETARENPTDEWKKIETVQIAEQRAKTARCSVNQRAVKPKNRMPVANSASSSGENQHRNHSADTATTEHGANSTTTIDISERVPETQQVLKSISHAIADGPRSAPEGQRASGPFTAIAISPSLANSPLVRRALKDNR